MLRKLAVRFLGIGIILLVSGSFAMAQRRVNFARGRTSATVSGALNPGRANTFAVRCFRGQLIRAYVRSGNGRVDFAGESTYSVMTDRNGDYFITVLNHGGTTRFTLTITIQ
jgi:hypothetical protein